MIRFSDSMVKASLFLGLCFGQIFLFAQDVETLPISGNQVFSIYRNMNLNETHPEVTRVIIMIHGVARNADEYFAAIKKSAQLENVKEALLIAPHFKLDEDKLLSNEIFWDSSGWKVGDDSKNGNFSSFEILEKIIAEVLKGGHFPNIVRFIIIGHSAGGQFVARFSAATQLNQKFPRVYFRYIIANPSSYLYFNEKRLQDGKFVNPATTCGDYNEYPYGLLKKNRFMDQVPNQDLTQQFSSRDTVILLGEADVLDDYLDMSCPAMLQGRHRLARGKTYFDYLKLFFPGNSIRLRTVPGIGHFGDLMVQSESARQVLFRE